MIKVDKPASWIIIFTLAVIIPAAILVFLGLQSLRDESLIIEKKLEQEDLKQAGLLEDSLNKAIRRSEDILRSALRKSASQDTAVLARLLKGERTEIAGHYFVLDGEGRLLLPTIHPLYYQKGEKPGLGGKSHLPPYLKEARRREFQERNFSEAIFFYRTALRAGIRKEEEAEILAGIARCYRKAGKLQQALEAYSRLATVGTNLHNPAGFPYSLTARLEKERILLQLSRTVLARAELLNAYRDLVEGTWKLPRDKYLYFSHLIQSMAEQFRREPAAERWQAEFRKLAAREKKELELSHLYYSLKKLAPEANRAGTGGGIIIRAEKDATLVYLPRPDTGGKTSSGGAGFIIDFNLLKDLFFPPLLRRLSRDQGVVVALADPAGTVVASGGKLPTRKPDSARPLSRYLPGWTVLLYRNHPAYARMVTLKKRMYAAILVPLFLLILLGLFFLGTGIRREKKLARLKSDFVSTVSHELKSPLTAIRMFAETLQLGRVSSAEQQQKYYQLIIRESDRLAQLINNILNFSKMEAGRKTYNFQESDLGQLVHEVVDAFQLTVAPEGYKITMLQDDPLPPVSLDRDAITQALLNLLSNAVKFSPEDRTIGVKLRRSGEEAVIEVTDRGMGISRKDQEMIFEKFFRAGDSLTRETRGTGLGLTITRNIARAHGGRVEVTSIPKTGSTFSIILPLRRNSHAENIDRGR